MSTTKGATWKNKSGQTHYENNKEYYKKKAKGIYYRNLAYIENLKRTGGCVDCKNNDYRVLDYDHLPEFEKVIEISLAARNCWSLKRLDEEIAKCVLRCANCHRIKTWERKRSLSLADKAEVF